MLRKRSKVLAGGELVKTFVGSRSIRPGQDYDDMVFVCVFPDRVEFYEADKQTVTCCC